MHRLRVALVQRATLVSGGGEEAVLILDIGLRGVFVERTRDWPRGTELTVRFRLPGNEHLLEARARVAWCRSADGLGLEFTAMSADDQGRLRTFLVEHWRRAPRQRRFARPWPEELQ